MPSETLLTTAVEALRALIAERGPLPFRDFMQQCLYAPGWGYYTRAGKRIGLAPGTDFYTASQLIPVFPRLVLAALEQWLPPLAQWNLVELGAEPGWELLAVEQAARFASFRQFGWGDKPVLHGKCILFANELLDAQPFTRVVWRQRKWREMAVDWQKESFVWKLLDSPAEASMAARLAQLPPGKSEGYIIDLPTGAECLLTQLVAPAWTGGLLFFDYGTSWQDLLQNHPSGSVRAYSSHRQRSALLERPGEQDLTGHVCWDHLEAILRDAGFEEIRIERQEAFFHRLSHRAMAEILAEADPRHLGQLRELLHPGYFGSKFQVLTAVRR